MVLPAASPIRDEAILQLQGCQLRQAACNRCCCCVIYAPGTADAQFCQPRELCELRRICLFMWAVDGVQAQTCEALQTCRGATAGETQAAGMNSSAQRQLGTLNMSAHLCTILIMLLHSTHHSTSIISPAAHRHGGKRENAWVADSHLFVYNCLDTHL